MADYTVFVWVTSILVICVFYHAARMVKGISVLAIAVYVCVLVTNGLTVWIAIEQMPSRYMYCRLLAYIMHHLPILFVVGVSTKPNSLAVMSGVLLTTVVLAYVWMNTSILGIHNVGTVTYSSFSVCTPLVIISVGHTVLIVMCVIRYIPYIMWNRHSLCLLGVVVSLHLVCGILLSLATPPQWTRRWTSAHVLFVYLELVVSCRVFLNLSKAINHSTHCVTCDICKSLTCQACPVCTTYADIYRWYVRKPPRTQTEQYIELDEVMSARRLSIHANVSPDDDINDNQYNKLEYTPKPDRPQCSVVLHREWTKVRMFTPLCVTGEWLGCTLTPAELVLFLEHITGQYDKFPWTSPLSYNLCQELLEALLRYNNSGSEPVGLANILRGVSYVHTEWLISETNAHILSGSLNRQLTLISYIDHPITPTVPFSSSSSAWTRMTTTYEHVMMYLRFCVQYQVLFVDTGEHNSLYAQRVMGSAPCLLLIHVVRSVIANGHWEVICTRNQVDMMMSLIDGCADSGVQVSPLQTNLLHTADPLLKHALETTPVSWLQAWLLRHNREAELNCGYTTSPNLSAQLMAAFTVDAKWEQAMSLKQSIPYLSSTMLLRHLLNIMSTKVVLYRVVLQVGYQQWIPLVSMIYALLMYTTDGHTISDDAHADYILHETSLRCAKWSTRVHANLHVSRGVPEEKKTTMCHGRRVMPQRTCPFPSARIPSSATLDIPALLTETVYRTSGCTQSVHLLNILLLRIMYIISRGHTDYCFVNAELNGFMRSEPHMLVELRSMYSLFRTSRLCGKSSDDHLGCSPLLSEIVHTRLFTGDSRSFVNIHRLLNNIWLSHRAGIDNIGDDIDNNLRFVDTHDTREMFLQIVHPVCMVLGGYCLDGTITANNLFQAMYVYYDELRLAERQQGVMLGTRLLFVWLLCTEYGYNFPRLFRSTLTQANEVYIPVLYTRLQSIHRDRSVLYCIDSVNTTLEITEYGSRVNDHKINTTTGAHDRGQVATGKHENDDPTRRIPWCCSLTPHSSIDSYIKVDNP
jgi:hypothetical protein